MTIQQILDQSRAVFHPFRSAQQVAGLGFQSLENVNLAVSKGLFQWESQLDIVFRKGRYLWYRAGKKANRFDQQLELIIDKAEETQGIMISRLFKLIDWLNRVGEEEE